MNCVSLITLVLKKLVKVPKSFRNHPLCLALDIMTCPILVASRQLLFYKRLLSSDNMVIKTVLASDIGHNGTTVRVHLSIRREYGLMALDLSSASRTSIINAFNAHLKRLVNDRNRNDAERLALPDS